MKKGMEYMESETLMESFKCHYCGEMIELRFNSYSRERDLLESGMVTYDFSIPCPICSRGHYVSIDNNGIIKITSTNKVFGKNEKASISRNLYISKTKEERLENLKQIFIKFINS